MKTNQHLGNQFNVEATEIPEGQENRMTMEKLTEKCERHSRRKARKSNHSEEMLKKYHTEETEYLSPEGLRKPNTSDPKC